MESSDSMILTPDSIVEVRITNGPGKDYTVTGKFAGIDMETSREYTEMTVRLIPQSGRAQAKPAKRFTEFRRIAITVPSLSPDIVAQAAAQAGYEGDAEFRVESYAGSYILTFTEEYLAEGFGDDGTRN